MHFLCVRIFCLFFFFNVDFILNSRNVIFIQKCLHLNSFSSLSFPHFPEFLKNVIHSLVIFIIPLFWHFFISIFSFILFTLSFFLLFTFQNSFFSSVSFLVSFVVFSCLALFVLSSLTWFQTFLPKSCTFLFLLLFLHFMYHNSSSSSPVRWGCRIRWLHLCREVRHPPLSTSVLNDT